jgi:hypothetical protein
MPPKYKTKPSRRKTNKGTASNPEEMETKKGGADFSHVTLLRSPILTVKVIFILLCRLIKGTLSFMGRHFLALAALVALAGAF